MGVFASVLIFISIILFATVLLPYFNDTAKMITTFVLSFAFTGVGLWKLKKDKENKFLLDITITKNQKPEVKKIPLIAPHKITTITGSFADYVGKNSKDELIEPYKNDYIIFICTDDVLPDSPMQNLKTVFPFIKSFRMEEKEKGQNNNSAEERIARQNIIEEFESKPENLFNKFLEDINAKIQNKELEKKEKELFLQYIKKEQE